MPCFAPKQGGGGGWNRVTGTVRRPEKFNFKSVTTDNAVTERLPLADSPVATPLPVVPTCVCACACARVLFCDSE